MPELGQMDPIETPPKIGNLDIWYLCALIDTEIADIVKSPSSSGYVISDADFGRVKKFYDFFKGKIATIVSSPVLDLPKYHPKSLTSPPPPVLRLVQNREIQNLVNLYVALRIEMAFSEESENASGLGLHLVVRVNTAVEKIGQHIADMEAVKGVSRPNVDPQEPDPATAVS